MNIRPFRRNLPGNLQKKMMILCWDESAHMPHNSCIGRNTKLRPDFRARDRFFEWSRVDTVVEDAEAGILSPIPAEQLRGGELGRGEAVRRVAVDPRSHQLAIAT